MRGVDRKSPLPLWAQIQSRLRTMLGGLEPGARFYTDVELSRRFDVNRLTVRQALQPLVQEGLLERWRGSGTFVGTPKVTERLSPHANVWSQWTEQGRKLRVQTLEFAFVRVPPDVVGSLRVAAESEVLHLRRLRCLDKEPVAIDDRFLTPEVGRLLTREAANREPLVRILPQVGVPVTQSVMEIEATAASREVSALLRIPRHAPVLLRTITYFSQGPEPILWGRSVYRADKVRYILAVPPEPATAAENQATRHRKRKEER